MQIALKQAENAATEDEVPVGAVIVNTQTNEIIAESYNKVERLGDPCAHAEILAIREATNRTGKKWLIGHDIYVTLEPCPMCAYAISLARLDSLYYGAADIKGGGVDNGARVLHQSIAMHKPEIYGGIMQSDCEKILKDFFKAKR